MALQGPELLEVERYVAARLWFAAAALLGIEERYLPDLDEIGQLRDLVAASLDASENKQQHEWISHTLMLCLDKRNSAKTKDKLDLIQFHSNLKLISNEVPETVEKELLQLFQAILHAKHEDTVHINNISPESCVFLETSLFTKPAEACWLVNDLLNVWPASFFPLDLILKDIYTNIFKSLTEKENTGETLNTLLCILSKLHLTESKENELLDWLYPHLLEVCDTNSIELALYSRKNPKLLKEWHTFLDNRNYRSVPIDNLESVYKISSVIFFNNGNNISESLLHAKELTLRVIKSNVHWLLDILDICAVLINNREYDKTSRILSCSLLQNLWPSLLLHFLHNLSHIQITSDTEAWQKSFNICESIKFLLNKCCSTQYEHNEPILVNLNATLNNHLSVVKWILEYRKKHSSSALDYNLSVKSILDGLQENCILDVLKKSIDIHECNNIEIENLLKDNEKALRDFKSYRAMQIAFKTVMLSEFGEVQSKNAAIQLAELETSLNSITPLSLRLEVIENIFSMLFLRYETHFESVKTKPVDDEDGYETSTVIERNSSAYESRESIGAQRRQGFVCDVCGVRGLLNRLQRCVVQLGIDFAKLRRESSGTSTEELELLQKRIFRIDSTIADAVWRLELLTSREFVEAVDDKDEDEVSPGPESLLVDEKFNFSSRLKSKAIFYNESYESSDEEIGRELKSDASSEASSVDNAGRRKKRIKGHGIAALDSVPIKQTNTKLIINLMLASRESLVLQCLWKADYARAQQVIEMFDMKGTRLDGQVRFSKAMQNFRNEVTKQMSFLDTVDSVAKSKELQILENVRRAAQGGYQSSRLASQLETFLAAQEPSARLLAGEESGGGARELLALCALDLGLTVSGPASLLEAAAKHARLARELEAGRHARHLDDVLRLAGRESGVSPPALLCDATLPLRGQENRADFWRGLAARVDLFWASQTSRKNNEDGEAPTLPGQTLLAEIASLCGSEQPYLRKVITHLQLLQSIVPNDERDAFRTESILLGNSLDSYFGHQIFDLNVEPESLEVIANKIGVNLVHIILVNCCPNLTCYDSLRTVSSDTWGCVVLNKNLNTTDSLEQKTQDPNQCVADILLELLQAIKRLYLDCARISNKDLDEISKDADIQQILNKTAILESLDLSELSVGEHTTAFFLNLWNLLFLHAQLTVWVTDPPLNSLRHCISLSSINYHVGDLGRISLATLRSKLLGSMAWNDDFFTRTEDLNEVAWQDLDLVHDPRVIFAMANEFHETPIVRIYYPQTLNKDLNEGLCEYLSCYSKRDIETRNKSNLNSKELKQVIRLPEIVKRYEKFLETNVGNLEYNNISSNQSCQNIFSVIDYFSNTMKNSPSKKSEQIIFKYESVINSYELLLKYENNEAEKLESMKRSLSSSAWSLRSMKSNVLHYLEGHCWLLSYLVKRLHKEGSPMLESGCDNLQRTACFENISASPWVLTLAASLFNDNPTLATISENLSLNDLWEYLEKCLKNDRIKDCLDVINALPRKLLTKSTEIQCLKDKLLCQLVNKIDENPDIEKVTQYIYQIKDINVLAQTILSNINKWPVHLCQDALFHALHHKDKDKLPSHCRFKMNETLCRVTVFYKMLPYCKNRELTSKKATWQDVLNCTEKTDPAYIVQSLIEADKFELCLEWLEYQSFSIEIQSLVTQDLLVGLLKNDENNFKNAHKLLVALPKRQSMKLCKGVLKRLDSIKAMKFIVDYLLENCETHKAVVYYKAQIGVEILDQLDPKERCHYIHLIKEPLLMLEQLLMNCKFKILRVIIDVLQRSDNLQRAAISIESFDEINRFYAGKSLDFRVSLQRDGVDFKTRDSATPSVNESRSGEFAMPVNVPTKEEWIPNDKARECSCCRAVIFSMFNRRHHCRRCGRVVCAACSQQRMQVAGYPKSVLVRVCDDCKQHTVLQMQAALGSPSTASSVILECWRLTTDEAHNRSVREEFSFEHAPNVSMCLAILSLHSDHKAYASFLLDRCHEMKKLLQPGPGGRVNPEVDHALIIKMIRSLLLAVKVKCAKLGLNTGLMHCDRFLSQVDLIATLVQSDCLALIPTDDSLDEHALRKLRDLLAEKEHWTLALDVSTKSGLDTQGVWAAWGKACLKVGYFDRARSKFSHCLEKVLLVEENSEDWVMLSYPDMENKSNEDSLEIQRQRKLDDVKSDSPSRRRQTIKNRPTKDPPLLVEILQILENQSQLNSDNSQIALQVKPNVAQEIITTLNSLKAISQNQFSLVHDWNFRNVYYEESLYYLLTYGSCNSILEFFVKYEEFNKCLAFILENNVEPELFFNSVYLRCLNVGNIENLLNAMRTDDSSLLTWKKYLVYTCHSLDKKQYLHTLYHLQLFMRDFIRAAMTCIRFYMGDARNYADLRAKSHFLVDAQKHLETELNVENLSKRRRKSVSSTHSSSNSTSGSLTMEMEPSEIDKHINTISRQMEIVKFLGNAEKEGRAIGPYLRHLIDMDTENAHSDELPTLFGNQQQKTRLAVLAILCGRDTEEGFGIAFRIMQDYNLRPQKVYSLAGHVLALEKKVGSIEQLIKCCRSSGAPDSQAISDRVLTHCVKLLLHNPQVETNSEFKDRVDSLIRLIDDVELKISSYIESKQLKAAYLLAVKHQRAQDIRKILKEADRLGQNAIRTICTKWLNQTQNSL